MPWYRKHYTCPCGTQWWDEWDCLRIPGEAAQHSGMMPPSHSEMMSPTVPG